MPMRPTLEVPQKKSASPPSPPEPPPPPSDILTHDATSAISRNGKDCVHVVALSNVYQPLRFAAKAALDDAILRRCARNCDRLHKSPASLRPIPRLHIHMLAPETFRTVIGVPVTCDVGIAMLTREVLDGSFKHS